MRRLRCWFEEEQGAIGAELLGLDHISKAIVTEITGSDELSGEGGREHSLQSHKTERKKRERVRLRLGSRTTETRPSSARRTSLDMSRSKMPPVQSSELTSSAIRSDEEMARRLRPTPFLIYHAIVALSAMAVAMTAIYI